MVGLLEALHARFLILALMFVSAPALMGASATRAEPTRPRAPTAPTAPSASAGASAVMLGIDVLAADDFAAVRGKRIGLLTHPAGVDRRGRSTIAILHAAPQTQLVALFAPEHGLYATEVAGAHVADSVDRRTGLPVHSLHGSNSRKPTPAQLRGLDALVIDLQDIGVRSYTFNVVMRYALDACFAQGVEVILLDRPNPLGGYKVDGPLLDRELMSGVGAFRMPYVHGMTMGELARWAARTPGVLDVPEAVRAKGRLTVIPMRGWRRAMRWPETGLRFVPTSQNIRDFAAVVGYAMSGLGCEGNGFTHGAGGALPFRSLAHPRRSARQLQADLMALQLPGLRFTTLAAAGEPERVYIEVSDWGAWNPTQLSFHLMRLACRYEPPNPYARLGARQARTFNIHVGSSAWWQALKRDGARVDVQSWVRRWQAEARAWQQQTRRHQLYR